MKQFYFITILIVIFSINASSQEGWINQTAPFSSSLSGVYAIDSMNVWAVGQNGLIIHTTNGGLTWDSIPNGTTSHLYTVEFINADTGFVAGRDGNSSTPYSNTLVQRTTDGGLTWEFQNLPGGNQMLIMDIDFVDGPPGEPMRGYCVGGLSHAWKTYDYGETWEHVNGDCGNGNFNSCFFSDSITGWFVGTPSNVIPYTIMYSNDGCESFIELTDPNEIKLNGVCFGSDSKGIAVGNAGIIMYTSDGGAMWENSSGGLLGSTWTSVFLTETGNAWAVDTRGTIAYSNDWGHTWEAQESGLSYIPLWEVYFVNDNVGWAVGGQSGNTILHTKSGGRITTTIRDQELTKSIVIYPNPVCDILTIESNYSLTKVEIYSIVGTKVKEVYTNFSNIQTNHLTKGIYILNIHSEKGIVTKTFTKE